MKKTLIAAILISPMAMGMSSVMAAPNNVGCGLGSTFFDGQEGTGPQILAATTNGSSGNQTFGITSGTSGCDEGGVVTASASVNMFVGNNLDALSRDMSVGQGESLESLAQLMGISANDKSAFFTATRANYGKIFSADDITAGKVLDNLHQVMAEKSSLAQYSRV
ncbi:MAG: DUF3015 domain-containing protein [Ectothiorhodospiraceae bacterium]|nr:DUF3015 domain-containing protein [Ectothiorhodospiraceae bacterium]